MTGVQTCALPIFTPMIVRSCPVEICDFNPRSRKRSMIWSTWLSDASGFNTIIMVPSQFCSPYVNTVLSASRKAAFSSACPMVTLSMVPSMCRTIIPSRNNESNTWRPSRLTSK